MAGEMDQQRSSLPVARIVRVLYDFSGENNDELCLRKGDLITITQLGEGGWSEGTDSSGITGWFPSNYVEPVEGSLPLNGSPAAQAESLVHLPDKTNQQYRKLVIKEINDTEAAYIIELKATYQQYLLPLLKSGLVPENELSSIIDAFAEVIKAHSQFQSALDGLQRESSKDQRIGGAFLNFFAHIQSAHLSYCGIHPRFVSTIEKHKDPVSRFIKSKRSPGDEQSLDNGSVLLTSNLSYSFRRLDKYPALLQELQRYTDECHPDRGDTQRASHLYRELVSATLELRRKKEMELEVMLGNIRGWPTEVLGSVECLGQILLMGPVTVLECPESGSEPKKDRYLVLFQKYLVLLSISNEMTSFTFENCFKLEDMTIPRLPDVLATPAKANLELLMPDQDAGATLRYIYSCGAADEVRNWIATLNRIKCESGNLALLRSSLRREKKNAQRMDSLPRRGTSTLTSESSSSGSFNFGASGGAGKGSTSTLPETRSSYWQNKSLLPHAPLRSPCVPLENGMKTSATSLLSVRDHQARPSSPSDDMAILHIIEGYYFTAKKNQQAPAVDDSPHIILVDDENIAVVDGPVASYRQQWPRDNGIGPVAVDERNLVGQVSSLVAQVGQMRQEIDALARAMEKERKVRKRLKATVGHLSRKIDT